MIRDLIHQNVHLGQEDRKGWQNLKCPLCHDYKNRGAFNFNNDEVVFNCFNCNTSARYQEGEQKLSHKLREVLLALGINDNDIDLELGKTFFSTAEFKKQQEKPKAVCYTPEIALPDACYALSDAQSDDIWATIATEYLALRGFAVNDYPWYLSNDKKYKARIIIPYYRRGKIIYWQARSVDENNKFRYLNAEVPRDNILFGYNFLEQHTKSPLFIVEGIFDAINVKGISLLGSVINNHKLQILESCPRDKVVVVDKDPNGIKLGKKALKQGWAISFVDGEVKDVNDGVQKYGKLWTLQNITQNIKRGFEAEVYLESIKYD